jgi:WW domain-containing oxidoreductase
VIQTNLARHIPKPSAERLFERTKHIEKTVEQGAATQCYVATHPALAGTSGTYFSDCAPMQPIAAALDDALADQLWAWTEALTRS